MCPPFRRTAMAIKEAMRLYPPAYALGRLSETENEIGGYSIPAGAYVVVSEFATHRHPQFWMTPRRSTPSASRRNASVRGTRTPISLFGGGPRACIGSRFATLEAAIAVAVVLQRSQIRSDEEDVPLDTEGITPRPNGAVPLRPAAR